MEPFAYGLRDHEVLNTPWKVNQEESTHVPTPPAWRHEISEEQITVLPIVSDTELRYPDGWCVYTYEHTQAPELEIICGGINSKTPKASAIWRQGFLMHFGFEPSPDQMNENGRALLVNSICYIAKCRQDRPIVRTPSVFYSRARKYDRGVIDRLVKNPGRELAVYLEQYLASDAKAQTADMDRDEVAAWFEENRGFLAPDSRGRYAIDEQAKQFGLAVDTHEFVQAALNALESGAEHRETALALLGRYVLTGPGEADDARTWRQWYTDHRDYLFFTDTGGFGWQVDPLAKTLAMPTMQLRGAARIRHGAAKFTP